MAEMVEAFLFTGSREMWMLLDRWWQFQQHWAWILAVATAAGGALLMQRRKLTLGLSCVEVSVDSSPSASSQDSIQPELTSSDVALKPKVIFTTFHADSVSEREMESDQSDQSHQSHQQVAEEDCSLKGTKGKHNRFEEAEDESSGWSVPEWARSLLQPVPLYSTSQPTCATVHPEWESILDKYAEIGTTGEAKSLLSSRGSIPSCPLVVFRGPSYLAKAREEVVKLWGSSRKMMRTWYLAEEEGHVSAVEVEERWGTVTAGTTNGYLTLWDIGSSERLTSQRHVEHGSVGCVRLNPEFMRVISATESCVEVWDPRRSGKVAERMHTRDRVLKMECMDNQLYVRQGRNVRGYDLRKLGKFFEEEEVSEVEVAEQADDSWDKVNKEVVEDDEFEDDEDEWSEESWSADSSHATTGGKSFIARCLGALWR